MIGDESLQFSYDKSQCKLPKFLIGYDETERNEDSVGRENKSDNSKRPQTVDRLKGYEDDEDCRRKDSKQTDISSNPNCLCK